MKTVRLPMYDEDGMELESYLEVDVTVWLSSTAGLRSNLARVITPEPELAQWEIDLLNSAYEEEEWRTIEGLPTKSFQVNRRGQIRHMFNQKVIEPSLDLESPYYTSVKLKINGLDFYVNGPKLAEQMWGES
jgi:hypothetical protein